MKKTRTNLLRAGRLALAFAALPLSAITASATLTTYAPGDVFIGFRQTDVANTLVAKIGTTRDFLPASLGRNRTPGVPFQVSFGVVPGTSEPVTNLNADLTAVFGSSWANNPTDGSGVRWGVVGWNANTGETSSVAGLATRSLFVTRGRTDPSVQTSISPSISAIGDRGGFATAFTSFAYGTGGGSYINQDSTANSSVAYIGAASDTNNWGTRINTSNAGFGLGSNRAVDQTPLSGAFSGPTSSVLDLWLSPNTGSTLATSNTYLGSFTLSANGVLTFTPDGPPFITSSLSVNGTIGSNFTYQIHATNNPTSYNATGLPAGLTLSQTGIISGIPTELGNFTANISISNLKGERNSVLVIRIIRKVPSISGSGATINGTVGSEISYQIIADESPTSFGATGLPPGLTINSTTGLIRGIPQAAILSAVSISATNAGGTGTGTLTFSIKPPPPVISSATLRNGRVGTPFSYQITASNNATSFGATGLPAGLSVNEATGLISGTPSIAGNSTVTISATNSGGTGNASLAISIAAVPVSAPVIRSAASQSGRVGTPFRYQITASNNATSFGATGLPAGLNVNPSKGLITGTPTAVGNSTVKISASNSGGTGTQDLRISILSGAPSITSKADASGKLNKPFRYQITASNNPTSFRATGLPAGLKINAQGLVSGTPSRSGVFNARISATNRHGTGTKVVKITISK